MGKERYEQNDVEEYDIEWDITEKVRELQQAKKQYEIAWERYYKAKKDLDIA